MQEWLFDRFNIRIIWANSSDFPGARLQHLLADRIRCVQAVDSCRLPRFSVLHFGPGFHADISRAARLFRFTRSRGAPKGHSISDEPQDPIQSSSFAAASTTRLARTGTSKHPQNTRREVPIILSTVRLNFGERPQCKCRRLAFARGFGHAPTRSKPRPRA